ncbi:beta strand repeat-containing protein, partial [Bradyrhizobium sp. HKCCYLS20291]|uniref:beta strand repeat-containing protein n=1 Tax=Bradyrhizobium sp. HKCCYLS20291 TaxID=3420766 RepID=UPI003EBE643F
TTALASTASGANFVSAAAGGSTLATVSTGANGYYYVALPGGTLGNNQGVVTYTRAGGGPGAIDAVSFTTTAASGTVTTLPNLDLHGGWRIDRAGAGTSALSTLETAFAAAAGSGSPVTGLILPNRQISFASPTFALDQALSVTGTLVLDGSGSLTQTAGLTVGTLVLRQGSFDLGGANQAATIAADAANVSLNDTASLTVGNSGQLPGGSAIVGVTTSAAVTLTTSGDLTIASGASITGASPVLSAAGAFINEQGSGAVTASSGRWLIYSSAPAQDTFGGLNSANDAIFGQTIQSLSPGSVGQSGNRYVFANHPVLTVTSLDFADKTYGDVVTLANPVLGTNYSISGFPAAVAGAFTVDTSAATVTGAPVLTSAGFAATANAASSPYTIQVDVTGMSSAAGYAFTVSNNGTIKVVPRAITVSADAQSRTYGNANPTLTYAVGGGGLVNGDVLTGALATAANATSNVGGYAITQGSLGASSNYAVTYVGANLQVTPRSITVAADPTSRAYGDANPALSYTVGGAGLVNGDTLSGALATAASTASNVGSYAITQGSLAASSNYALTYVGANLQVTPRSITVAADATSRAYGDANPALSYTVGGAGLVNGDTLSGALTAAANTTSNVGSYAITQGSLAASSNYAVSFSGASLQVTPRLLNGTAVISGIDKIYDASTAAGGGSAALTAANNLVNGDSVSFSYTSGSYDSVNAGARSVATLTGMTLSSANYAIGSLSVAVSGTISPRPITVTANDLGKLAGAVDPPLTYTISSGGLLGNDALGGQLARAPGEQPGVYAIGQGTLSASSNYTLTYRGGTFTVVLPRDFPTTFGSYARPMQTRPAWTTAGLTRGSNQGRSGQARSTCISGQGRCLWLPHADNRDLGPYVRFAAP